LVSGFLARLFLAFWLSGFFGFLAFLAFWHFGFWLSGSLVLAFWLFGFLAFLAFWLFGILAFWLFWLFWLSAPFVFLGTHSHSPPPPQLHRPFLPLAVLRALPFHMSLVKRDI
jgi:hypothetical protein